MGFLAKVGGWAIAHKDALFTAFKIFKGLRGRRKATQESGESVKEYYLRVGGNTLKDVAKELKG